MICKREEVQIQTSTFGRNPKAVSVQIGNYRRPSQELLCSEVSNKQQ